MALPVKKVADLHSLSRKRFEDFEFNRRLLPWCLRPCSVRILIVTDTDYGFVTGSFSQSYFGLSALLDALRNQPDTFVNYDVTKAHRQTDPFKPDPAVNPTLHDHYGPDFEGFRFDQAGFNINDYDEVWLIGVAGGTIDRDAMSQSEIDVLAQFMEDGRGVFAVGDHATYGQSLCRDVPRVRSMRKWTAAQGVPNAGGPDRHDTLLKGDNAVYTFDDESDDVPMKIVPKWYNLNSYHSWQRRTAPHPVLCGRDGVIDILPDHPHEGEVIETANINLGATYTTSSLGTVDEFPNATNGGAVPEVIAWAFVQPDHTAAIDINKGQANAKRFGAIGAYDGQDEGVGRVVVDSTWHHIMDVNLTGRPISYLDSPPYDATNPKTQGFNATPAGQVALARIENYFQNIALWLAPDYKQRCLFMRAVWGCVIRYPLAVELTPEMKLNTIGEVARDAIGRRAGQCTRTRWIWKWFIQDLMAEIRVQKVPSIFLPPSELIENFVLGGIVREMLTYSTKLSKKDGSEVSEKELANLVNRGAKTGLETLKESMEADWDNLKTFQRGLRKSLKNVSSQKTFLDAEKLK